MTWSLDYSQDGALASASVGVGATRDVIPFRQDAFGGPRWYGVWAGAERLVPLQPLAGRPGEFAGRCEDVAFSLAYRCVGDRLLLVATVSNHGASAFAPRKAGLRLGIDTYMATYPEWDDKYFPSLLRCERSHFWGYLMTPSGRILGVASPDPVASWSMEYTEVRYSDNSVDGGHRIHTVNLDLLHAQPLPARHPQQSSALAPGATRSWTVVLFPCPTLSELKPRLADICRAPMIELARHTLAAGERTTATVWSPAAVVLEIQAPAGELETVPVAARVGARQVFEIEPQRGPGVYTLVAGTGDGRRAEARLYLRQPWSWYLCQARAEAVRMPQKASTHMESWLGCFSAFLARKHFPDATLDARAEANFREILPLMFDVEKGEPAIIPHRIQNTAAMIGLLADVFEATGNRHDLDVAARLADWLILNQDEGGGYRTNLGKGCHYTSVAYLAKYMMELVAAERTLAAGSALWAARAQRHHESVRRAVDDLERRRDNVQTEGEMTFEDGMISCTAMQLALFALEQTDPAARRRYADAALEVMTKHRCLEQVLIPDCRMIGGTLRFWESQYDVLMKPNMLNSPHGWSSWKTYGTWYLYLLTGEVQWLRETMDALGSAAQMIDAHTGRLRWAFVPDPFVQAMAFEPDPANPGQGRRVPAVIGEQYVDMLSGWFLAPPGEATGGYWKQGGCCDNDVHEHFKCLAEVALASAYVFEHADGTLETWNCRATRTGGSGIVVEPYERIVDAVHVTLRSPQPAVVRFADASEQAFAPVACAWLRRTSAP